MFSHINCTTASKSQVLWINDDAVIAAWGVRIQCKAYEKSRIERGRTFVLWSFREGNEDDEKTLITSGGKCDA